MRVVVIGGGGHFGARLCRRLAAERGIQLIATVRRARPNGPDPAVPVRHLDSNAADFAATLRALAPDVVVHCAGPFQGQDYRVALAALACRAHYIDLADGRDFVAGFAAAADDAARTAGRAAVTGASTLPALSTAVLDRLASRYSRIDTIDTVIAPGQRTPRGLATVAAVLGYAGKPFRWWEGGQWKTVHGWQNLATVPFSFGRRLAAACDVPDLDLLPARYPTAHTVRFRASLELVIQQRALWSIAAWRRAGMPLNTERWAPRLSRLADVLDRFGGDTGGMMVRVEGRSRDGIERQTTWEIVARNGQGPEIPVMAAALLILRLARGESLPIGAGPCTGILTLQDFENEFARWNITTADAEEISGAKCTP